MQLLYTFCQRNAQRVNCNDAAFVTSRIPQPTNLVAAKLHAGPWASLIHNFYMLRRVET